MTNVCVVPEKGEHIDAVLRRFKKATERTGVIVEVRRREGFIKKSQRRRLKANKARARQQHHDNRIENALRKGYVGQ